MTQLWTPSDALMQSSPSALQLIAAAVPLPAAPVEAITTFDIEDDVANADAAAVVLAELDDDASAGDETGECDDDDQIDDPGDSDDVAGDI